MTTLLICPLCIFQQIGPHYYANALHRAGLINFLPPWFVADFVLRHVWEIIANYGG